MSELADIVADIRSRILLLEEHARTGLIDRGELRRETAVLKTRVDSLEQIVTDAGDEHVTRTEFTPVRALVFGAVGAILLAVVTALVALVVRP